MITKEQALTANNFVQIRCGDNKESLPLDKSRNWRRNGKTKTWKTRPNDFNIPVKHGLYDYGYITQDNAHLFNIAYESIGN